MCVNWLNGPYIQAPVLPDATSPAIFPRPLDPDAAIGKVDAGLSLDSTRLVREKAGH